VRTKQRSNTEARLGSIIDQLQESGRYWFTREDVADVHGGSEVAIRQAALRLQRQSRIVMPRRGFYVIVPLEYRSAGAPPPAWFIDALMAFQGRPYYVGLLSAAALHGAAHQQAQEFQVITDQALRPVASGRMQLRFFVKKSIAQTPTVGMKVETGTMQVSTPEATVFDLVRYPLAVGGLGNIVTVFADLAEKIDPERLVRVAAEEPEIAAIQRAGLLLESVGAGDAVRSLSEWLAERKPRTVALRADRNVTGAAKNQRWRVLVNERIQVDE
jgi:predicted transcriptional regulator of viral defense system